MPDVILEPDVDTYRFYVEGVYIGSVVILDGQWYRDLIWEALTHLEKQAVLQEVGQLQRVLAKEQHRKAMRLEAGRGG
jgi:hypothetical protein